MISTKIEQTPPEDRGSGLLNGTDLNKPDSNRPTHKGGILSRIGNRLGIGFLKRLGYNNKPFAEVCLERLTRLDDLRRLGDNGILLNTVEFGVYGDLRHLVGPVQAQRALRDIQDRPRQPRFSLKHFPITVGSGINELMIRRLGRLGAIVDIEPANRRLVSPGSEVKDTDRLLERAYAGTVSSLLSEGLAGEDIILHPAYAEARLSTFQDANQRFCGDWDMGE